MRQLLVTIQPKDPQEGYVDCAISGCPNKAYPVAEPVKIWKVDTYPAEFIHVGLVLCHEHAAPMSWSM